MTSNVKQPSPMTAALAKAMPGFAEWIDENEPMTPELTKRLIEWVYSSGYSAGFDYCHETFI